MNDEQVSKDTIYRQYSGSTIYGTSVATSDVDIRGVCILSDLGYYFGYSKRFEQKDKWDDGVDRVIYEYRKAVKLIADGNPNMVDLLFVKPEFVITTTPQWDVMKENRDLFLSTRMQHTFTGYAYSQLKKLDNGASSDSWNEVDKKVGYKCKHGMHLVRLLRMGLEIVQDGEVNVWRDDADELLSIRNGSMSIKELNDYAEMMQNKVAEAVKTTSLPRTPDHNKIEELCVETLKDYLLNKDNK